MSLFPKNTNAETAPAEESAYTKKNRANNVMFFRVLAAGYILYMLYTTVRAYIAGGEDAPSLTVLLLSIVVLGGGGVAILIMAWREYQRNKKEAEELEAAARILMEEETAQTEEEASGDAQDGEESLDMP